VAVIPFLHKCGKISRVLTPLFGSIPILWFKRGSFHTKRESATLLIHALHTQSIHTALQFSYDDDDGFPFCYKQGKFITSKRLLSYIPKNWVFFLLAIGIIGKLELII